MNIRPNKHVYYYLELPKILINSNNFFLHFQAAASKKPGVKSTLASKGPVPVKKAAASAVASKNTNGTEVPKVNGVNNGVDNGVNNGVNGHSKPVEEEVTPTPTVEA